MVAGEVKVLAIKPNHLGLIPRVLHGGRREPTPTDGPLTPIRVLWHVLSHTIIERFLKSDQLSTTHAEIATAQR